MNESVAAGLAIFLFYIGMMEIINVPNVTDYEKTKVKYRRPDC